MAATMEIVTFNCQGLRSSDNRETAGGSVVSSFVLIVCAWVLFYVTLFTADVLHVGHQDFFLSHRSCHLSNALFVMVN